MQTLTHFKLLASIAELNCHSSILSFAIRQPKEKATKIGWSYTAVGVDFTLHNCLGLRRDCLL